MMHFVERDTLNFGYTIYRDNLLQLDSSSLLEDILNNEVDILIVRVPSKELFNTHVLNNIGLQFIVADCIVEYVIKPTKLKGTLLDNSLTYLEVEYNQLERVKALLEKIFFSYKNHYYSNPYLPEEKINNTYWEWIRDCVTGNGTVYLITKNGTDAAFFSGRIENNCLTLGLGGVAPEFEGEGIYLDAIRRIPLLESNKGALICKTGTQISNQSVQKQWNVAGWSMLSSSITIHINCLFGDAMQKGTSEIFSEIEMSYGEINLIVEGILTSKGFAVLKQNSLIFDRGKKSKVCFKTSIPVINHLEKNKALVSTKIIDENGKILGFVQTQIVIK